MKMMIEMSSEQRDEVEKFVRAEGQCWCGRKLFEDERRALLGQPLSSKRDLDEADRTGKFEVVAVCYDCWIELSGLIRARKQLGKIHEPARQS